MRTVGRDEPAPNTRVSVLLGTLVILAILLTSFILIASLDKYSDGQLDNKLPQIRGALRDFTISIVLFAILPTILIDMLVQGGYMGYFRHRFAFLQVDADTPSNDSECEPEEDESQKDSEEDSSQEVEILPQQIREDQKTKSEEIIT